MKIPTSPPDPFLGLPQGIGYLIEFNNDGKIEFLKRSQYEIERVLMSSMKLHTIGKVAFTLAE